jgi:hypothetical protein
MKSPLRSPAFRRWFGDSKVVDAHGKPKVVYHGTPRGGFTSFRSGRQGLFFFTAARQVASSYIGSLSDEQLDSDFEADPTPEIGRRARRGIPGIYRVYLRLLNPLVIDAGGRGFDAIDPEAIGLEGPDDLGPDDLTVDEIAMLARERGHDGLIVRNLYDTGLYSDYTEPSTVYVAFDPRQIKSATVQRGTFDPDSTDIRENASSNTGRPSDLDSLVPLYLRIENPGVIDMGGARWSGTEKRIAEARAAGHDGVIIRNSVDDYGTTPASKPSTVYVFFSPTQAKSAQVGVPVSRVDRKPLPWAGPNDGTFDLDDPDLRSNGAFLGVV